MPRQDSPGLLGRLQNANTDLSGYFNKMQAQNNNAEQAQWLDQSSKFTGPLPSSPTIYYLANSVIK